MTHAELIDAKGAATIAAIVGQAERHMKVWKHRGIPRSRWADLIDAFPDVTLEMLKAGRPQ